MKFAFLTYNGDPWGGSEVLWAATANRALDEGHEVLVSMFSCEILPRPIQELKDKGATIHFRRRFYPNFVHRFYKKAINFILPRGNKYTYHNYINKFRPNHILFSLGQGGEIAQDRTDLMVFTRQTRFKYSIFSHEMWLTGREYKWYKDNLKECFEKADNVFFTSKKNLKNTQTKLDYNHPNLSTLNHPLQVSPSTVMPYPDNVKTIIFSMLGTLHLDRKGQDIAIKALSSKEWLQRDWQLNIYGAGRDEAIVQKLISDLGLQNHVKLCGFAENISNIWKDSHIILIPSIGDSGPITLFESMLVGRAVVGSNVGAMPEYINDAHNGMLAKNNSIESFRDALEHAWKLRDEWKQWGLNARDTMLNKYDFEADKTLLEIMKRHHT